MADFELVSPDREDIRIVRDIPANLKDFSMVSAETIVAECSFGDMLFSHVAGDGYDIWKSNYHIHRSARVIGRMNQPILELTSMYENSFSIDWTGVTAGKLPMKQMELYYAPYVDNTAQFQGGKQYMTFDIHFNPSMLATYAPDFPLLDQFLEKVEKKEPARLFGEHQFATEQMNGIMRDMIQYSYVDALAPRYFDSYVHILLILLLKQISGFVPRQRIFSATDIANAHEAKRLLTANYEASYTINQLCRILGTNPYSLKTTFKALFGTSIGKYKITAFMNYARQLLLDTEYSLDEIALLLGYSSQQSLHTPFKKHFGVPPGSVRRRGK
jgi:AraC-like DNA-binding protein